MQLEGSIRAEDEQYLHNTPDEHDLMKSNHLAREPQVLES